MICWFTLHSATKLAYYYTDRWLSSKRVGPQYLDLVVYDVVAAAHAGDDGRAPLLLAHAEDLQQHARVQQSLQGCHSIDIFSSKNLSEILSQVMFEVTRHV